MMQGIQSLGPGVAEKMAAMGRFEDDQIAHVAEGEVIVPAPIIKYYPEVKKQVFDAMKDQGLDPEQFIVGGEMVAINPNTGVQEFGFLSKAFKKIKKIVKKAAPLLIAAALPMAAPAVFGSAGILGGAAAKMAVATAADTALKGGNLREVLESGAKGAALGGIGQFASNLVTGGTGGYLTGADYTGATAAQAGTTAAPTTATSSAGQANADAIKAGMEQSSASTATGTQVADASTATGTATDFAPPRNMTEYRRLQAAGKIAAPAPADQVTQQMIDALPPQPAVPGTAPTAATAPTPDYSISLDAPNTTRAIDVYSGQTSVYEPGASALDFSGFETAPSTTAATSTSAGIQSLPDTSNLIAQGPVGPTAEAGRLLDSGIGPSYGQVAGPPQAPFGYKTGEAIKAEFVKNPLQATATTASLGSTVYGLFGGGDDDQGEQQVPGMVSGEDLQAFLNNYNYQGRQAAGLYYNPETGDYQDVPYVPNSGIVTAYAGGHIRGPGTGTSDSIPAYLSDGEFVMTADAVKGAGGGDREKGAAKMYAMMNKFEGMA